MPARATKKLRKGVLGEEEDEPHGEQQEQQEEDAGEEEEAAEAEEEGRARKLPASHGRRLTRSSVSLNGWCGPPTVSRLWCPVDGAREVAAGTHAAAC